MKKPELKLHQFAVLVMDGLTGHVLNIDFEVYIGDDKQTYWTFDDLELARYFALGNQKQHKEFEYCIYDNRYELVEYIPMK